MAPKERVGNQLGGLEPEKELSMRTRKSVPIARGFTEQRGTVDTVKAEKGELWPIVGNERNCPA